VLTVIAPAPARLIVPTTVIDRATGWWHAFRMFGARVALCGLDHHRAYFPAISHRSRSVVVEQDLAQADHGGSARPPTMLC